MNRCVLLSMLLIAANLSAQTTIVLPDVQKPHQIAVDGNDLYVFDEAEYSLHVYAITPFSPKLKIGQKGDGPRDFKYLPLASIQPESLTYTEMLVLDLEGRVLKRLGLPLPSIRPERGVLRYDLFTVSQDKLYELVQNKGTGKWELLITDLNTSR